MACCNPQLGWLLETPELLIPEQRDPKFKRSMYSTVCFDALIRQQKNCSKPNQASILQVYIVCMSELCHIHAILTAVGFLSKVGVSKQPSLLPHNSSATSGTRQRVCLTKPQGVSQINTLGLYFKDMYKSAASLTDSVRQRNLEAKVHYNKQMAISYLWVRHYNPMNLSHACMHVCKLVPTQNMLGPKKYCI